MEACYSNGVKGGTLANVLRLLRRCLRIMSLLKCQYHPGLYVLLQAEKCFYGSFRHEQYGTVIIDNTGFVCRILSPFIDEKKRKVAKAVPGK